ncbi:MAG: hypothetical protein OXB91_04855 [Bryobacterales bacterium]|nr:hypothetical protein [Bryobacterales bacterium]
MKQQTAPSTTPSHGSMVALLTRLGASPGEAYNVAEEVATEARLVANEMAEGVKLQVLSRIDSLQGALEGFKSEVTARFKAIDQRFEAIDQRFKAVDQRFDGIDQRFDGIEQRFDIVNQRLASMERHMERHFEQMHRIFGGIQSQVDYHHTGYRRLLLLLVIPVALALLAGVGGMIWEGIANWSTELP